MQISRHWRLNAQRYRLEGTRYPNGVVTLQDRPVQGKQHDTENHVEIQVERQGEKQTVNAA